jgi:hypothetical protein
MSDDHLSVNVDRREYGLRSVDRDKLLSEFGLQLVRER